MSTSAKAAAMPNMLDFGLDEDAPIAPEAAPQAQQQGRFCWPYNLQIV